jgi:hypothetical protein
MAAAGVIAPVVLPPSDGRSNSRPGVASLAREPLPLPCLPPRRTSAVVYGASAVDDRGRVADRVVLRALGWPAGHRLDIREAAGTLAVVPNPGGSHQITGPTEASASASERIACTLRPRLAVADRGDRLGGLLRQRTEPLVLLPRIAPRGGSDQLGQPPVPTRTVQPSRMADVRCYRRRGSGKPRLRYPGARFAKDDPTTGVFTSW